MIKDAIAKLIEGQSLTEIEAENVMLEIMDGQGTPSQIGSYLTALRIKGETVEELTGSARAMRAKAHSTRAPPTNSSARSNRSSRWSRSSPIWNAT